MGIPRSRWSSADNRKQRLLLRRLVQMQMFSSGNEACPIGAGYLRAGVDVCVLGPRAVHCSGTGGGVSTCHPTVNACERRLIRMGGHGGGDDSCEWYCNYCRHKLTTRDPFQSGWCHRVLIRYWCHPNSGSDGGSLRLSSGWVDLLRFGICSADLRTTTTVLCSTC